MATNHKLIIGNCMDMSEIIKSKKYTFVIFLVKLNNYLKFFVKAIHKRNKRYSYINNLNCILSEYRIEENNPFVSESQWDLPEKKAKKFFFIANNFLKNEIFIKYIEKQLDLDRKLGEWENKI